MIQFGYKTAMIKNLTREERMAFAKELGLAAIEVNGGDITSENDGHEWMELSAKYGILMKSVGGAVNMCNPVFEDTTIATVTKLAKLTKMMDFDMVFSRTLWPVNGVPQKDTWNHVIQTVKRLADICEDAGIKFAIEVDHGCFIDSLERALILLHYVNQDNLYFNYDPTNMYIGGADPVLAISALKGKIVGGHIKDAVYRQEYKGETGIGFGEIDYSAIFNELNQNNIDIIMHYEHCKTKDEVIWAHQYIGAIFSAL